MTKLVLTIVLIGILALIFYSAFVFVQAIMPHTARPEEIKNPQIIFDEAGQRYLRMDVYGGHSALNPDGVMLREKDNTLIIRPVYCLIDPPITLCRPDAIAKFTAIEESVHLQSTTKIPNTPERILLKFRYGDDLELK